jgi:hypothetical protein
MPTCMTRNGVSTTVERDRFQYERFQPPWSASGQWYVQWDYRDVGGELHSGIAKTEDEARTAASKFGYRH